MARKKNDETTEVTENPNDETEEQVSEPMSPWEIVSSHLDGERDFLYGIGEASTAAERKVLNRQTFARLKANERASNALKEALKG